VKSDSVYAALAVFDSVRPGDVAGYRAALTEAQRLVKCPIQQLSLVDSILEARQRAYSKEAA
jgi:hypothetical protein